MKAYVLTDFGRPAGLQEVPRPVPEDDEILVRVRATSVNPVDRMVADGFFRGMQEYRFPAVFGRDLCGTVEATGASVTRFAVGDTVWGFIKREHIGNGTFAEYVTSPVDRFIAAKPANVSVVAAGVLGLSSVTALECLDALHPEAGQTVLINGATGGLGSFAVQIAASWGLTVIATARPGAAADYVRSLGAHQVVDWTTGGLADAVRAIAPAGVHGLVDLVRWDAASVSGTDQASSDKASSDKASSDKASSDKAASQQVFAAFARSVLRPGGRVASVTNAVHPGFLAGVPGTNVHSTPTSAALARITALVEAGDLRSPIDSVFPFDRISEAFDQQEKGALGKVAVTM